jgi:hypothetical protein
LLAQAVELLGNATSTTLTPSFAAISLTLELVVREQLAKSRRASNTTSITPVCVLDLRVIYSFHYQAFSQRESDVTL